MYPILEGYALLPSRLTSPQPFKPQLTASQPHFFKAALDSPCPPLYTAGEHPCMRVRAEVEVRGKMKLPLNKIINTRYE